jgi:hypothetical protein
VTDRWSEIEARRPALQRAPGILSDLGKVQMVNEAHAARWRDRSLRDIIARMRHDGCGGRAGKVELLTGIEGASSRPVRRIVLIGG